MLLTAAELVPATTFSIIMITKASLSFEKLFRIFHIPNIKAKFANSMTVEVFKNVKYFQSQNKVFNKCSDFQET